MFGKILRAGKGGHGQKYKIDLQIIQLENLPTSIKKCRVVWARSAKLQITDIKDVRGSVASFKQTLTQVTTIYRDKTGKYEPKEYEFKVQVPGKSSSDSPVTVGKATLDMAKYCKEETTTQPAMVPITFKIGTSTTGYLKLSITTVFLGDSNDDGLTEVSGMTGLTSDHGSVREQDLEGFGDDEHSKFSKKAKGSKREDGASSAAGSSGRSSAASSRTDAARRHKPLPPTAEEDASDLEDEPEPVLTTAKSARRKSSTARPSEVEEEAEGEANPFAKKVSKPPSRRVPPKVWEDDEDVSPLNSDISDSETPPKPRAKKAQEPEQSLDDMKASLFATKTTTAASSAGRASAGTAASAASAGAAASKAAGSKAGKAPAPPLPPPEDEDEDSLRNDLFTAKSKSSVGATSSKSKAAAAAEAGAAASRQQKAKAAPPPPRRGRDEESDDEDEDDGYGPSTSSTMPSATAVPKSRSKAADTSEAPILKGSSSLSRAGSAKPDAGKGGSAAELEQLRQRVAQLEKQLGDEQTAKEDLNKKLQKYADKMADLEDQLAEGDVAELFAQMKEMEAKHQAEIKDMEAKYQAEIKDLMERHLAEVAELDERHQAELADIQEAAGSSGRGGASVEELKRLQAELGEQEARLRSRTAKLEAEQVAANAARQAAESKLAEANKMVDESLLVATKHQQENKALQDEVARLKRQLEDASAWDTSAAVVAATSAANNGRRRSSEDDAELEELREKMEELQEENERLQRLNEAAQGAAESLLSDIRALLHNGHGEGSYWSTAGSSSLDQLASETRRLCGAYTRQSFELRCTHDRLAEMQQAAAASTRTSASGEPGFLDGPVVSASGAGGPAKVKPHELLSRVQQLTAERDSLQEKLAAQWQAHTDQRQMQTDLAAAQKLVEELRQQIDTLRFEKQAVERFKVATIADLRRQNDQLRNSLRSLSSAAPSPRTGGGAEEDLLLPVGTPQATYAGPAEARFASGAGSDRDGLEGNWHEFESLVAQLKGDRADLQRQVEQLKADKASLGKQVEDLRSAGGAAPVPAAAVAVIASTAGAVAAGETGLLDGGSRRVAELERERTSLQAEVARLQAQLAELAEADAIIKEWSDYADGLVADKMRLEQQVQELTQRLGVGERDSLASDLRIADAERRVIDWQRRVVEAERKVEERERCAADAVSRAAELEGQAAELEQRAADAVSRAAELEGQAAELEHRAADAVSRAAELEGQAAELEQRAADAVSRAAELEGQAAELEQRAADAVSRATELEGQAARLERRVADAEAEAADLERQLKAAVVKAREVERLMDAAERRALEAEGLAQLAEQRAVDAESRASAPDVAPFATLGAAAASAAASPLWTPRQQQPADTTEVLELRRQIARLEESLSLLRTQLLETQSPAMSPGPKAASSARGWCDPRDASSVREALSDAGGSCSDEDEADSDVGGCAAASEVDRGWHAELEELRARNASLEATVAGLQASLEVALQQAGNEDDSLHSRRAEGQIHELQSRLSYVLQEKAELESTVVLLRAELERAPLVAYEQGALAAEDSAADGPGVASEVIGCSARNATEDVAAQSASPGVAEGLAAAAAAAALQQQLEELEEEAEKLRKERSELRAAAKELQLELQRLEDEKNDAEATASRLSSEMEELAEALDASNSENERLSLEVLALRDQLEQLEGSQAGRASRSQSIQSSKSARPSSGTASESGNSGLLQRAHAAQVDAENELAAVRAAARDLIRQVATGGHDEEGFEEEAVFSGLGDDDDLTQALRGLRGQISELQRQSRQQRQAPPSRTLSNAAAAAAAVAAAEAQLAQATTRIDELQQLLEDAEIENQHLTEQLEECLTAGRKGPDSVGSVAEECQSSYNGSAAAGTTGASNPYSYGHANTLTLSAFEQRLAMAEGQRDELTASLAEASATNRRLEADVAALQQELAAVRRGLDPSMSGGLDRSFSQVSTRGRTTRAAPDDDKKRLEELQAANRKLEAVCDDLEEKAQAAQERAEQLQAELEASQEKIRGLEIAAAAATASAATLQKRMEDELGGAGGRQSKDKVTDLEGRVARLSREKATLEEQLEEERATRKELEETLKDKLDRAGDDEAAETVAAFEVKYNRLKERYKMLEESSQEELDELQDQLTEAQSQVANLQRQIKQLQSQLTQSRSAGAAAGGTAGMSSGNMEELRNLRSENERLVQQLVAKKMELAELSESEITLRRELARLHEVNMKLAQKATTLEAQAAMAQAKAGRGKK
ncbi:hypothetical protein PLESTB_001052900 [Pleodorina starrii]|uniref:C2 NT-type domain-containing protein n=1 Tax=Pleodorina starrii TaxID=330485 RepID=A0A9W6F4K9_9CHLO|nr:hypothetical protein PLESTB_001052900 [Pleodorina starrii]